METSVERSDAALPPGSVIGILGSGQLARMLAMAAARLGLACHIYADAPGPAFDVAAARTVAPYDDMAKLEAFAQAVDAVTYEFENIPLATVEALARHVTVRPGAKALGVAQDRLAEKQLARRLGYMTAPFEPVDGRADLDRALATIGLPAILKTRRFGYDGKGQAKIRAPADAVPALAAMQGQPAILEGFVEFDREVSVIGVRGVDGAFAAYDVTENVHRDHILHTASVPAAIGPRLGKAAIEATAALAEAMDYVGALAVEFFVVPFRNVHGDTLPVVYVNEIAPRVHNSGHWTIEACQVSQFENHMRAVAGWPLGDTSRHSDAVMTNLIGREVDDWAALAAEPGASVHIYGKRDARPGRKMGHVTRLTRRG